MSERDIQEFLSILHDTQAWVSNSCWRATSLEEPSFLEDMEKIQIGMCNIKDCQRVYCLEDSHDMEDHEKCGNLNALDVFEVEIEEIQKLDEVEEELELSLDEGYANFKEEHDLLFMMTWLENVRIINPPLSKFVHMSKLGVMSKSGAHPVYL